MPDPIEPRTQAGHSPVWTVMALTWACSLGTGVGWNGIFFIAESALRYTDRANIIMAFALGIAYTGCAWCSAPLHAMVMRSRRLTTRGMLVTVSAAMGASCLLPFALPRGDDAQPTEPAFWVFAVGYLCLSGLLWPFIESFVSGGRQGSQLRRATALFNVTWASAVMAAMWVLAPVVENHPWAAIAGLGVLHLATIPLVLLLPREPRPHGSAAHAHSDDERALYVKLRRAFRALLIVSYIMVAAVSPVLPTLMQRLEIDITQKPLIASIWMTLRFLAFVTLWKWAGWHGKLTVAAWTAILLGIGFGLTFFATAVPVLIIGLATIGVGAGAAYFGALYYAMELDSANVDAGGKHEAIIGAGYAIGPIVAAALLWVLSVIANPQ